MKYSVAIFYLTYMVLALSSIGLFVYGIFAGSFPAIALGLFGFSLSGALALLLYYLLFSSGLDKK